MTMFRFITEGILLTVVSVFGIIGNILAIYILSRPVMKASFSTLLIGTFIAFFENVSQNMQRDLIYSYFITIDCLLQLLRY